MTQDPAEPKSVKPVDKQTSMERRDNFRSLMDVAVLPQRRRLLSARDHTWQSAYVDDDGYLAELIASLVVGNLCTGRKGVSKTTGDLTDGTEVKKGYRVDPNIDFVLEGIVRRARKAWTLEIANLPNELLLGDILSQLNSNACSVQLIKNHGSLELGVDLWRTISKNALTRKGTGGVIRFSGDAHPSVEGQSIRVCIRQERGHINFGKTSRAKLDQIIKSKPILVFYQHDIRGRFSVAVCRIEMTATERNTYLSTLFRTGDKSRQIQPYLFPDNRRDVLYLNSEHSVADGLRGRLLAYGADSSKGFEILHWNVTNPPLVKSVKDIVTAVAKAADCPPFRHSNYALNWDDPSARQKFADRFFRECIVGYSRALEPYCRMTESTRNVGLGNLAQHLASICTGLKGTRSGARGADLIEPDGVTPSEIKLATGQRGDSMGTEDMPRLTLGWDRDKMMTWKRLIAVRMVELESNGEPRWNAIVHAPNESTMKLFRKQVDDYFEGRVNNGSGGLQYHTTEYPHHSYGTRDHKLEFVPVAVFREGDESTFPISVPEW